MKKGKQLREWDLSGTRKVEGLDFSRSNENGCSIEEVVTTSKEEVYRMIVCVDISPIDFCFAYFHLCKNSY